MHQPYDEIEKSDYTHGLLIAGSSKTTDIEQTLITKAQEAKRVRAFLR
jgi:L-lactate utilization protein LutC